MDWLAISITFLAGVVVGYFVGGYLTVIDCNEQIAEARRQQRLKDWVG